MGYINPPNSSKKSPARVLILSASVGAGHLKAAEALQAALLELDSSMRVTHKDVMTLTNPGFRRLYGKTYFNLIRLAPAVVGYLYNWMDKPSRRQDPWGARLRRSVEKLNLGPFLKLLRQEHWDIIVNTHFLPAEITASLRRKNKLDAPQVTVTTDFETHRLWVHEPCERYFTATAQGAAHLQYLGVPARSISVTGIPVHPRFARRMRQKESRRHWGVEENRPMVLQMAGGFGFGPLEKIYKAVLETPAPLTVVFVAGHNDKVKRAIHKIAVPARHKTKILGYTDKVDELMAAADIVVSKPGGLTSSECLARGVPLAIVDPIPGQESRNSDYLLECGAALKINDIPTLSHKLNALLSNPARLRHLRRQARKAARPRAAYDIARAVLELIQQS